MLGVLRIMRTSPQVFSEGWVLVRAIVEWENQLSMCYDHFGIYHSMTEWAWFTKAEGSLFQSADSLFVSEAFFCSTFDPLNPFYMGYKSVSSFYNVYSEVQHWRISLLWRYLQPSMFTSVTGHNQKHCAILSWQLCVSYQLCISSCRWWK